ncbi:MAG: TIGR03560 family F420-dependent LLM class oxidoreductase [Anaerolineaceae bacterium]|nr:TIGR03560 family F420-dependent LLM class oxidoreductase [Anaerolineaceae bacterium]
MEVALMIEGQYGLNWPRLQRIAQAVEDLGFVGLYRSDHFTNQKPPDIDSLELWVSLTWLASHTKRIEFGPMVSPASFRHPAFTARMAAAVDDLSGGRLTLGLGAGWQEREHTNFSFDLLELPERFDRFSEGLEIITHLLQKEEPLTFAGQYYQMQDAVVLPHPQRAGGPPILIGGNGPKYTLPRVAQYASEWNAVFCTHKTYQECTQTLNDLLQKEGRKPGDVKRSLMTNLAYGRTDAELTPKLRGKTTEELIERGMVAGNSNQVTEQIGKWEELGVQRIMLQWLDLDDLDGLEAFSKEVLPQLI